MQGVGVVSVFFICTSILTFCLKTHPDMRVPVIHNLTVKTSHNTTMEGSVDSLIVDSGKDNNENKFADILPFLGI